jgi:eukaryotic-like serine/threonine-protein kinase
MTLQPGVRLGPYEIHSAIGAGGMGEVYKARDTRLDRTVAIKVLPAHVASDPEVRQRFEREARAVAALNHPHICTLHDIGNQDGTDFLVLEYLEGETLADKLAKGRLLLDQALRYGIEIADALDKAHRAGIVHRDLKPGNIVLTKSGAKLLDFGLAKTGGAAAAGAGLSMLPTTPPGLTAQGTILGTFQYMAPEQLEGKEADGRTDIFAFGAVLYEMLTGKKAFEGRSQASLIAAILEHEPASISAVQRLTPPGLERLVLKCLAKDPEARWHTAHDLHDELLWIRENAHAPATAETIGSTHIVDRRSLAKRIVMPVGAALTAAVVTAVGVWFVSEVFRPPPRVTRLLITPPSTAALVNPRIRRVAITPDGTRVVYPGTDGRLFVRSLDQLDATVLTVGAAMTPFVSPDGQWIGFGGGTPYVLRKVAIGGGLPATVARHNAPLRGATWGSDGTIIFADTDAATGLQRVGAAGGDPTVLTRPNRDSGELDHFWPHFLPEGQAVLFTILRAAGEPEIAILDLRTNVQTTLMRGGSDASYVPSGHLVYGAGTSLMAVAFDLGRLSVVGTPVPVVDNVETWAGTTSFTGPVSGAVDAAVASDGTIVYVPSATTSAEQRSLVWVDRQGREETIPAPPRAYASPHLSPDGTKVALDVREGDQDVWIWDFARENLTRLTLSAARERAPVWNVDGRRVFFEGQREGRLGLFSQSADGTGGPERLGDFENNQMVQPKGVSPDGKWLLVEFPPRNIGLVDLEGDKQLKPLIEPGFAKDNPTISPDGHWIAYESSESGRFEIYVRPFPAVDTGRWAISTNGGQRPVWSRDGRELFYLEGIPSTLPTDPADLKLRLMAVGIRPGASFSAGAPQVVFEGPYALTSGGRLYDVSPDGRRFLMIKSPQATEDSEPLSLVVVQHFDEELRRLLPRK